jgi:hypothetical protein
LTEESFDNDVEIPVIVSTEIRNNGDYSTAYVVTTVTMKKSKAFLPITNLSLTCEDLENVSGSAVTLRWAPVDDAKYYNVYRSRIAFNDSSSPIISRSFQVGYVGQARGAFFRRHRHHAGLRQDPSAR